MMIMRIILNDGIDPLLGDSYCNVLTAHILAVSEIISGVVVGRYVQYVVAL